jgi:hypothetical protein
VGQEKVDKVFLTEEEERAETALERYLEKRNGESREADSYRYFVLEDNDEMLVLEDVKTGDEMIYNLGLYGDEMKIERNVGCEKAKELLSDY